MQSKSHRPILSPLASLLHSRKFVLALLLVACAIVLAAYDAISVDQLVKSVLILFGIVAGSIALEDAAEKVGRS